MFHMRLYSVIRNQHTFFLVEGRIPSSLPIFGDLNDVLHLLLFSASRKAVGIFAVSMFTST
jgi:hypothetical protein